MTQSPPRRIAVVGAGGMGTAVAAFLARAGADVLLIGRTRPHIDAIAASGVVVDQPDGTSFTSRPAATADPASVPRGSVAALVVLTKTFDTDQAAEATAHVLASDGIAVSLQNGLGNELVLARHFGTERSLPGVTTIGAQRHEPGRITVSPSTAAGASISHIGGPRVTDQSAALERALWLAEVLTGARLPAQAAADADHDIWGKLALAVMGPASAVLRRTVGDTWDQPDARALIRDMFDEAVAVAAAEGVALEPEAAWAHAVRTYEGTGGHMTSMCTDVVQGRRTEIDAMAGEVVRRADLWGIDVPVHRTIVRLVHVLEATYPLAR